MRPLGSCAGFAILASDGRLGTVRDFLFDDATWHVRWMVGHTGTWLNGRMILVHPSDIDDLDYRARSVSVRLTMAQLQAAPDILLDEPVSRQIEYGLEHTAGWCPEWGDTRYVAGPLSGLGVHVSRARLAEEKAMHKAVRGGGLTDAGDAHLRSTLAVIGNRACASDGTVGRIKDCIAENAGWTICDLVVGVGAWWMGDQVLVSPSQVKGISWPDQQVRFTLTGAAIRASRAWRPAVA